MHTTAFLSRRGMLALLALLVSSAAGASHAHAATPMDERLALHLLNRLGHGPLPGEVARVRAMGLRAYVDSQLAPPPLPPRLEARLHELAHPGAPPGEEALLRAIASPRQLEEVLANFWLHWFMAGQDGKRADASRAALRPHVLGRYPALLEQARDQGSQRGGGSERGALRALAAHFVTALSAGLLRSLAQVWGATGGDQRTVLRALFTSDEFLAPAQWNGKYKDGWRFVVSAVRASGVAVENVTPLVAFVHPPMGAAQRADFVERLTGGRLALAMAPPAAHRYASSAPPMRATVNGITPQGMVARPGPVLMEAPTPAAAAMAAAARSRPADAGGLHTLLDSEDFLKY